MTKRAFVQLCILLVGLAFEAMGRGYGFFEPFPLSDYEESIRGYVYYNCEHIKFIAITFMLWKWPAQQEDFKTDGVFAVLAVVDWLDYLATGNEVWYSLGVKPMFPISFNMISILLFTLYANVQWKMNGHGE